MLKRKRYDPLWEIVGEKIYLQGFQVAEGVPCPNCHVKVQLPEDPGRGERYRCGLCGALFELVQPVSVADDGSAEVITRLAK